MKGKKKVKEPAGMNIPEIFAALAMLEKERGIRLHLRQEGCGPVPPAGRILIYYPCLKKRRIK